MQKVHKRAVEVCPVLPIGKMIFSCTENDRYLLLKISRFELYKDAYTQFILNSVIIIALAAVIAVFYIMSYRELCRAEDALKYKNKFISRMSDKFRKPLNKIAEYADSIKNSGAKEFPLHISQIPNSGTVTQWS